MSKKELTYQQEQIARIAKALRHPIRVAILHMSEILPVAKSTLSQHLNELKDAGLIQGEINLPSVKYCINKENWALAKKLLGGFIDEVSASQGCCK